MTLLSPQNIEKLLSEYTQKFQQTLERLPHLKNETELREEINPLLKQLAKKLGIEDSFRSEYSLFSGKRADTLINKLVIEYEAPFSLQQKSRQSHAVHQLKDYLAELSSQNAQQRNLFVGVAFDGETLIFVRWHGSTWHSEVFPLHESTLKKFLGYLIVVGSGKAFTPENLRKDFGLEQNRSAQLLRTLWHTFQKAYAHSPFMHNLFRQWQEFFSQSIDYQEAFGKRKLETLQSWAERAGIDLSKTRTPETFFFVLHTYFALLVKLIALAALLRYTRIIPFSFERLASLPSHELQKRLEDLENGHIFHQVGIQNFLEDKFFSWYLHAWGDPLADAIREILSQLAAYDPSSLTLVPENTRDLFKHLYHNLLPRPIRHHLGEYYTPDWLAQYLLKKTAPSFFEEMPSLDALRCTRFLDPACGSGTFLLQIIARIRQAAEKHLIPPNELLTLILQNVTGFDLNPIAVLSARTSYLLALLDLLDHRQESIEIPIYLADSIRTPAQAEEVTQGNTYVFPLAIGDLYLPIPLVQPPYFDRFCTLVEESLEANQETLPFLQCLQKEFPELPWQEKTFTGPLHTFYDTLLEKHKQNLNGIWSRILKNTFAPLSRGVFDYVVGNPPWINWENLPEGYRERTKHLWVRYKLAGTFKGGRPRLGAVKVDISALMTYGVMDKLLKNAGKLGFVITQSVFKTAAGAGLRKFSIPQSDGSAIPLKVICVEDLAAFNPFEGASNRTALMVLQKGEPTSYPVPYILWRKKPLHTLRPENPLEEVLEATHQHALYATPVDHHDSTSTWLTAPENALHAIQKVLGKSDYKAHEGVNTGGANGVYWVEPVYARPDKLVVVRNLTRGAKTKVEEVTRAIEVDLLYPLLRGRDVQRWKTEPSALILLVHNPDGTIIPEKEFQFQFPKAYTYLKQFEKVLRNRKDAMVQGMYHRGLPFYAYGSVSGYTFAPWKIVWRGEVATSLACAVCSSEKDKVIIPDQTVYMIATRLANEAHFLCSILNTTIVRGFYQFHGYKHVSMNFINEIRLPRYDPENEIHKKLAQLSQKAHQAAQEGNQAVLSALEAQIDQHAAQLWALTPTELDALQKALDQLQT
ncbi:MAG: Eco57I restriction-modification methylase domain-containing protein [Bacteroidia bacterium]